MNRAGLEALYLSSTAEVALAEYTGLQIQMPPTTVVQYEVSLQSVVNFAGGYDPKVWHPLWQDFFCDWRTLLADKIEPPSWVLGDMVYAEGHRGILFPSQQLSGGLNLVIYVSSLGSDDVLACHDPNSDLPRNRDSWLPGS